MALRVIGFHAQRASAFPWIGTLPPGGLGGAGRDYWPAPISRSSRRSSRPPHHTSSIPELALTRLSGKRASHSCSTVHARSLLQRVSSVLV